MGTDSTLGDDFGLVSTYRIRSVNLLLYYYRFGKIYSEISSQNIGQPVRLRASSLFKAIESPIKSRPAIEKKRWDCPFSEQVSVTSNMDEFHWRKLHYLGCTNSRVLLSHAFSPRRPVRARAPTHLLRRDPRNDTMYYAFWLVSVQHAKISLKRK